jgi:hypothetical protein
MDTRILRQKLLTVRVMSTVNLQLTSLPGGPVLHSLTQMLPDMHCHGLSRS